MKKLFLFLSIFFQLPDLVHACSCIGSSSVKYEIKHSDLVISGQILSKSIVYPQTGRPDFLFGKAHYIILVLSNFKGSMTSDTITIITGLGSGDCGVEFQIGKQYIVYGRSEINIGYGEKKRYPNTFETDICTRTKVFDDGELSEIQKYLKDKKKNSNGY